MASDYVFRCDGTNRDIHHQVSIWCKIPGIPHEPHVIEMDELPINEETPNDVFEQRIREIVRDEIQEIIREDNLKQVKKFMDPDLKIFDHEIIDPGFGFRGGKIPPTIKEN